jgi:hypothetical protein
LFINFSSLGFADPEVTDRVANNFDEARWTGLFG